MRLLLAFLLAPAVYAQLGGSTLTPPTLQPPSLNGPLQDAVRANEVVRSAVAARGSDPSTWFTPARAVIAPRIVPARPVAEHYRVRMAYLVEERERLRKEVLFAGGQTALSALMGIAGAATASKSNFSNGGAVIIHPEQPLTPGGAKQFDGPMTELNPYFSAYLAVLREIQEMKTSGELAHVRYVASMKELGVTVPTGMPTQTSIGEKTQNMWPRQERETAIVPDRRNEVPQMRTVDCSNPIVEDSYDWVLVPVASYVDEKGKQYYNQIWKKIEKRVVSYPPGCE
jgi:hypothetical protein